MMFLYISIYVLFKLLIVVSTSYLNLNFSVNHDERSQDPGDPESKGGDYIFMFINHDTYIHVLQSYQL